jgi:putative SOS response-associated peptidase YedK
MCGRFAQTPALTTLFGRFKFFGEDATGVVPRYNIAPTQNVPIIFRDSEGDHLESMRWGLVPHWTKEISSGKPLINARGETAAEKPSFRTPFKRHRCLVPASGFYEWKRKGPKKIPYFIRLSDNRQMCFAGLWDRWDAEDGTVLHSFTIITTFANELVRPIHDRMPVILREEDEARWLDVDQHEPKRLKPLLVPYAEEEMEAHTVSPLVNSVAHDSEDCLVYASEQGDLF